MSTTLATTPQKTLEIPGRETPTSPVAVRFSGTVDDIIDSIDFGDLTARAYLMATHGSASARRWGPRPGLSLAITKADLQYVLWRAVHELDFSHPLRSRVFIWDPATGPVQAAAADHIWYLLNDQIANLEDRISQAVERGYLALCSATRVEVVGSAEKHLAVLDALQAAGGRATLESVAFWAKLELSLEEVEVILEQDADAGAVVRDGDFYVITAGFLDVYALWLYEMRNRP